MKSDMSGASAVLHALLLCKALGIKQNVLGVLPLVENMISGNAYRPDDILQSHAGLTVEVKNTDAEGRLILADALSYAATFKPQAMIDMATLTGAPIGLRPILPCP